MCIATLPRRSNGERASSSPFRTTSGTGSSTKVSGAMRGAAASAMGRARSWPAGWGGTMTDGLAQQGYAAEHAAGGGDKGGPTAFVQGVGTPEQDMHDVRAAGPQGRRDGRGVRRLGRRECGRQDMHDSLPGLLQAALHLAWLLPVGRLLPGRRMTAARRPTSPCASSSHVTSAGSAPASAMDMPPGSTLKRSAGTTPPLAAASGARWIPHAWKAAAQTQSTAPGPR